MRISLVARYALITFAVVAVISLTNSASAAQRSHSAGKSSDSIRLAECRTFVQRFYTWYRGAVERAGFESAVRKKPHLFNSALLQALQDDLTAAKKSPGEIVGLDFDPFTNSQDLPESFVVGDVRRKGDIYLADVSGQWTKGGARAPHPWLVAELKQRNGRWMFTNFRYPPDKHQQKSDDLLSILARLKAERKKKP